MISEKTINEVKLQADIVYLIGGYLKLKKLGANFTGSCPFHSEKTASFTISPAKGIYKCFGCGVSGDLIKFLIEHDKLNFNEAIEKLADSLNIKVEYVNDNRTKEEIESDKEKNMLAQSMLSETQTKYIGELKNQKNATVVDYLQNIRKLSPDTILEWQLGFAPNARFITESITEQNRQKIAEEIGLIKINSQENYDVLQIRVTIPIEDHNGRLVGFAGRNLPKMDGVKDNFKYLNPKESFLYKKSKILFGLNRAIISKAFTTHGMAILTEGYFDTIAMHQASYNCTVATCGTALTKDQAKLLRKYTDKVIIMRDGDAAGLKASINDLEILLQENFEVKICVLPNGKDADDCSHDVHFPNFLINNIQDAINWRLDEFFKTSINDELSMSVAIGLAAELLAKIPDGTTRMLYQNSLQKKYNIKPAILKPAFEKAVRLLAEQKNKDVENASNKFGETLNNKLPRWVNMDELMNIGFVQLENDIVGFKSGIYFKSNDDYIKRATNYTIKPLFHINEQHNNRRLLEIWNGTKRSFLEMPSRGFISSDTYQSSIIEKGNYTHNEFFTKSHFIRLMGWLCEKMPYCWELKTLGWQHEGFFAFSNKVILPEQNTATLKDYSEMGIAEVGNKNFISLGASLVQQDYRIEDNIYENDQFLKYVASKHSFAEWSNLFCRVYGTNAPIGIAYTFITIFKDLVTETTKCPLLYAYGPKGSGKSDFCESILHLFFSGKDSQGKPIQGYNLNPGQGTPFSFHNLMNRFRNVPVHFNEFDENNIENWVFGSFKAFYDGQGREVGDGNTGKARKTTIQKPQGTILVAGQYLSTRDDGSVLSRSVTCQFNLSKVEHLTHEQTDNWKQLKEWENEGLSSIVGDLLQYRNDFKNRFPFVYWEEYKRLHAEIRKIYGNPEIRLVRNYALCLAVIKVMGSLGIELPFDYQEFYLDCKEKVISHNRLLKENNSLQNFWKTIEILYDKKQINFENINLFEREFAIRTQTGVKINKDGKTQDIEFVAPRKIIFIRFSNLYAAYAKAYRERTGKAAQDESSLLKYLQDQPYYYGRAQSFRFDDKVTSAYALDYEKAELSLENNWAPDTSNTASMENMDQNFSNQASQTNLNLDSEIDLPL